MTTLAADNNYGDINSLTGIRAVAILLALLIYSGGGGLRELSSWSNFLLDCGTVCRSSS